MLSAPVLPGKAAGAEGRWWQSSRGSLRCLLCSAAFECGGFIGDVLVALPCISKLMSASRNKLYRHLLKIALSS